MNIRLTAREREVAGLVAEGLTNREIAERLVVSERTAEGHVEQIRNKLGFRSRSQIAAWAAGGGLAAPASPTTTDEVAHSVAAAVDRPGGATRTFLFADLRGYTEFVERHGDAEAAALITDYRRLVREQVARAAGAEVKTEGDSFYVVFSSARQALDCAVAIVREAAAHNAQRPDRPIRVGIGVHAGEPVAHDGQFVGSAVNLAARLAQSAGAGEILVSDVVRGLLRTSGLPPAAAREIRVKGVGGPVRAFAVAWAEPLAHLSASGRVGPFGTLRQAGSAPARRRPAFRLGLGALAAAVVVAAAILTTRPAPAVATLVTIAGLGTAGFSGDGGPATVAQLYEPTSMAFDRAGDLVFADSTLATSRQGVFDMHTRIRRVDRSGTIATIAGDGSLDYGSSNSGAALGLGAEAHIALGPSGELYIAHGIQSPGAEAGQGVQGGHWVGRVDLDGRFRVLAGTGRAGYSGDGGPAPLARLQRPRGMAIDAQGVLYVADSFNNVVRAISPDGIVTTVAGTGERGGGGDGGPPRAASFFAPLAVAVSPDGSLYIADTNNHRIRKIDHGGNVVAVAGDGEQGYAGDGGPAAKARLSLPSSLAFGPGGVLYVADTGNARIRAIAPDGAITTVGGGVVAGELIRPTAVAIDANGTLFIGDSGAHRIFKLTSR